MTVSYMYLQARVTISKCEINEQGILNLLQKRYYADNEKCRCTWGFEERNSVGEDTDRHVHFHAFFDEVPSSRGMLSELGVEAHRKWFRDKLGCAGNKSYSIKLLGDVRDEKLFYGYPLKQNRTFGNTIGSLGFEQLDFDMLVEHANGQYTRNMQHKKLAIERQLNKNMFWDKLVANLPDELKQPTTPDKDIWVGIADYYIEQGKTPPWASLDDKVLHFKVQVGTTTTSRVYESLHIRKLRIVNRLND